MKILAIVDHDCDFWKEPTPTSCRAFNNELLHDCAEQTVRVPLDKVDSDAVCKRCAAQQLLHRVIAELNKLVEADEATTQPSIPRNGACATHVLSLLHPKKACSTANAQCHGNSSQVEKQSQQ